MIQKLDLLEKDGEDKGMAKCYGEIWNKVQELIDWANKDDSRLKEMVKVVGNHILINPEEESQKEFKVPTEGYYEVCRDGKCEIKLRKITDVDNVSPEEVAEEIWTKYGRYGLREAISKVLKNYKIGRKE